MRSVTTPRTSAPEPVLPSSCRWVDCIQDATTAAVAGYIPLIRPDDRRRAERWAAVMRWYDPADPTNPASQHGSDSAIASTAGVAELGQLAATALQRPLHRLDTMTDLARLPAEPSVLVVVPAMEATLSALAPALALWEEFGTRVGLLTGRDSAGMVFCLAKILAARRNRRSAELVGRVAVVNGPQGNASKVGGTGCRQALAEVISSDWQTVVINAAGGASHACLGGGLVLCGLTGAAEHDLDGQLIPHGCAEDRCKRGSRSASVPVHPHDLRTSVLGFFVPNAIAIGSGEQYASDVSLALDALDGFPAAVVGLTRGDADTTSLEPAVLAQMVRAGTPLGQAVSDLNTGIARRGCPQAVLLLGDPDHRPLATAEAAIPALDIIDSPYLPTVVNRKGAVPALLTGSQALLAAPDSTVQLHDAGPDLADLADLLRGWPARLAEAQLLDDRLLTTQTPVSVRLLTCLEIMRSSREEAARLVAGTLSQLNRMLDGRGSGLPANPSTALHTLSEQWASTLAALVATGSDAMPETVISALTAHHRASANHSEPAGPCDGCGSPCQRHRFGSTLPIGNRTEVRCPRCGITRSHPDGGGAIMLEPVGRFHPGRPGAVNVTIETAWGTSGVLSVQLRPDHPSRRATAVHTSVVEAGRAAVVLDIPAEATPDSYWIWAFYCSQFQVALARVRVPIVPKPIKVAITQESP